MHRNTDQLVSTVQYLINLVTASYTKLRSFISLDSRLQAIAGCVSADTQFKCFSVLCYSSQPTHTNTQVSRPSDMEPRRTKAAFHQAEAFQQNRQPLAGRHRLCKCVAYLPA